MRSTRQLFLLPLAIALASCAAVATAPQGRAPNNGRSAAVERGQEIAETYCSACHSVGPAGASPSAFAPPFRNIRLRYNPISLERHLADVVKNGAYSMPPQMLSDAAAEDVAAYLEWLRPAVN